MKNTFLKAAFITLGALYLIADANNSMDYEYAWDHSLYPPFTGKTNAKEY